MGQGRQLDLGQQQKPGLERGQCCRGLMATLEEFKALRAGVAPEVQTELHGLMSSDPEAGKQRMVEIAAAQGVTLTTEEVRGFLLQMDEEEEFDDIELDAVALAAVAGGDRHCGGRC